MREYLIKDSKVANLLFDKSEYIKIREDMVREINSGKVSEQELMYLKSLTFGFDVYLKVLDRFIPCNPKELSSDATLVDLVEELLKVSIFLLDSNIKGRDSSIGGDIDDIWKWEEYMCKEHNLNLKKSYYTDLGYYWDNYGDYIFGINKDDENEVILICRDVHGNTGILKVPLDDFIEDVVKLSEEYLRFEISECPKTLEIYEWEINGIKEKLNKLYSFLKK
ncbi:hypothetical protein [Methanotorris formicicus]|uniref:Uncharacterized protein n=1 Tax=Methanotorris formicicus Mc-S-70 TaxID=647171 RepID=H1KW57_9EURY|nr:hypothetical protein [Methanotorris formicicus]EHP89640.1 hypothetical protein MetfoDRAFT_0030 [Methanotorris formicicus Mc-S-70]